MKNAYARPKNGAGILRASSYDYIKKSLEKMFREQDKEEQKFKSNAPLPTLKEYYFLAVKHCLELANSGNVEAKKRLPEIFFRVAMYYKNGDKELGIVKNPKKAKKFLKLAIKLKTEQI